MLKKLIILFILIFSLSIMLGMVSAKELQEPYDVSTPEEFEEAPEFNKLVEKGELPPVEERLPKSPLVVAPNDSIGEYGGTLRSATLNINYLGEDTMVMDAMNAFVRPSSDGGELYLNFAKDIEISEEYDEYTFYLREGIKWSDGESFTTEDIKFWYEDILQNEDLTPSISDDFKDANGDLMEFTDVDDYTFKITFGTPQPYFLETLIHAGDYWFEPAHYFKQFHPNYASEKELEEKIEEEGYDHWYELFDYVNTKWGRQRYIEDVPTIAPYVLTSITSERRVYERNPYYWKVDSEGNQLPYIERIETDLVSDMEVLNGRIMSGEIDFAGFNTDIRNYSMFKKYEEEGNYRTLQWTSGMSTDVIYMFNHTHEDPDIREIFQDVNFKRAMSLAIDREEINETIYFGQAEPKQYTVHSSSQYYKPEYAEAYTEYDPEKAKNMLDEIGLVDEDGDGWRELPNGEDFNFTIEGVFMETPKQPNIELVTEHWRDIGINVDWEEISGELAGQRAPANMMDATLWHGDKATDILFPREPMYFVPAQPPYWDSHWPLWAQWFNTEGEEGEEPPSEIKELYNWYEELILETNSERRVELGRRIMEKQAENLWTIGTVGGAPWIVVADNNLRNLPDDILWAWDTLWSTTNDPEQFYFKGGSSSN